MKFEMMKFQGLDVGVQLTAETDEERRLLWALRNLPAKVSETYGHEHPGALFLCPQLPWANQTSVPSASE